MATVGQIVIGMSTDSRGLTRGFDAAAHSLQSFSAQVINSSSLIRAGFGGALAYAGGLMTSKMITGAADLNENIGKIGDLFGNQADDIEADARRMADAFGVPMNDYLEALGKAGGLFRGAGFDSRTVSDMSQRLARLALDASRAFNIPYDDMYQKLQSGMTGSSETLVEFGVLLAESEVKAQGYSMGLAKVGEELSTQAKFLARNAIIMSTLDWVQGNAAKTADGAAAKMEEFRGRVENLGVTFGEYLAPIAGDVLGGVSNAIVTLSTVWNDNKSFVLEWAGSTLGALGLVGDGLNILEIAVGTLANAWQGVSIVFKTVTLGVGAIVQFALEGIAYLSKALDSFLEKYTGTSTGMGTFFDALQSEWGSHLDTIINEIKDDWSKPWASDGISQSFQDARDNIARMRDEIRKAQLLQLPPEIIRTMGGVGKSRAPFAAAMMRGSKDAASTILRARYGSGGKDAVVSNTKETVVQLQGIRADNRVIVDKLDVLTRPMHVDWK